MKKRMICLLVAVLIAMTVFAGCAQQPAAEEAVPQETGEAASAEAQEESAGNGTEQTYELTFWHHESAEHRVAAFDQLIGMYEAEHPNVTIKQEVVGWGDANMKMLSAVEAGNAPDFQFGIPNLTVTAYQADAILPVTDLVEEFDQEYTYYDYIKKMSKYDGEYWSVPVVTMPFGLIYRPSLLEKYMGTTEPPQTWDELLDYAKTITEKGEGSVYGIGLGGGKNLFVDEQAYMFLAANGARFFDEQGNVTFDSPAVLDAFKAYQELYQYSPVGSEAWMWGEIEMNLASGVVAMAPYLSSIQIRMNELDDDDIALADMPVPAEGMEKGSLTYPNDVVIFKDAEKRGNLEVVKDFLRFIMKPENNIYLTSEMEPGGFVPCTVAAAEYDAYWENPIIQRYLEVNKKTMDTLEYSTLFGFEYDEWVNLGIGDIVGADVLSAALEQCLSGQKTPEEAVAWGAAEMEKMSQPIG